MESVPEVEIGFNAEDKMVEKKERLVEGSYRPIRYQSQE